MVSFILNMDLTDLLTILPNKKFYEVVTIYDVYSKINSTQRDEFCNAILVKKRDVIKGIESQGGKDYLLNIAKIRNDEIFDSLNDLKSYYSNILGMCKPKKKK
jgi:hypothetical protein